MRRDRAGGKSAGLVERYKAALNSHNNFLLLSGHL